MRIMDIAGQTIDLKEVKIVGEGGTAYKVYFSGELILTILESAFPREKFVRQWRLVVGD